MSCKVYLDNYHHHFVPGDAVVGRVLCTFSKTTKVREIRLKLRGREYTSWTKNESHKDSENKTTTKSVRHTGFNQFYAVQVQLAPPGDYPQGIREYPFTFNLPSNLPGSFQNFYGWIRYEVKATVDIPNAFDNRHGVIFDVVARVDLNQMTDLQLTPTQYQDEKTVCCCWCASGPITMDLFMEKEAFVVGEVMKVKVGVTNMSNQNVERLELRLGTMVQSTVTSPGYDHKYAYELIASANDTGVGAHGSRTYELDLEIPHSSVVPNFNLCTLFRQWSLLKAVAVLIGWHSNLVVEIKVNIGHIPFRERSDPVPPYPANAGKDGENPPASYQTPQGSLLAPVAGPANVPNAPPAESVPSAPSKGEIAAANAPPQDDKLAVVPPPSYSDILEHHSPPEKPE